MRIDDFNAKKDDEKKELEENLKKFKVEKILSLWYFVRSSSKATIFGTKN